VPFQPFDIYRSLLEDFKEMDTEANEYINKEVAKYEDCYQMIYGKVPQFLVCRVLLFNLFLPSGFEILAELPCTKEREEAKNDCYEAIGVKMMFNHNLPI